MSDQPVWIALSGGVDSAVAAALLVDAGRRAEGVTLRLRPTDSDVVVHARAVCDGLGIPHRTIDLTREFEERVVARFAAAYAGGMTPNACIWCNEEVKFGLLLKAARSNGAALATGHYARIVATDAGPRLARGTDQPKDQSYFLYRLGPDVLADVLLPIGHLTKSAVRELARARGLPTARHRESQDACFLAETSASAFVGARHPGALASGDIVDTAGNLLAHHGGIAGYTVGQRKGLPGGGEGPLYVVALDAAANRVVAGPLEECRTRTVHATDVRWYAPGVDRVLAQVRARMAPAPATVRATGDALVVDFDEPVCAAPGQAVVCYQGDTIAGGGTITAGERS
jgi:tRNA-specific 2-thiouridylase